MTIRYQPKRILKRMADKKNVEKLLTKKLNVNRTALNAIETSGVLGKKQLEKTALKVIKGYRKAADELRAKGATKAEAIRAISEDPRALVQQIQNATVHEITRQVKEQYHGAFYTWLPSTAKNPDKKHMKKYGKRFRIGKGEAPGDRFGCRCGMEIHVPESRLVLE